MSAKIIHAIMPGPVHQALVLARASYGVMPHSDTDRNACRQLYLSGLLHFDEQRGWFTAAPDVEAWLDLAVQPPRRARESAV